MAAILPLAETIVLGGVDGALRAADVKAGRTTNLKQWSTYLEAGLVAVGAIAAMQRVHPDYWEPAVISGLFGLSQRAGAWGAHAAGIGGPDFSGFGGPARGAVPGRVNYGSLSPAGFRPFGGPDPMGAPLAWPPGQHVQPAGALG